MKFIAKLVLTFLLASSALAQVPSNDFAMLSLADKSCPSATRKLYRCVTGGYFNALKIIKNMLGDEGSEHTSWKITSILNNAGRSQENLNDYHWAKNEFLEVLAQQKKAVGSCNLALNSTYLTSGGGDINRSSEALGIITTDGPSYAEDYCGNKNSNAVMLEINDKYKISAQAPGVSYAPARGIEYVIPGFISHDTITAGFTTTLAIYKTESDKTVEIKERNSKGFNARQTEATFIKDAKESQKSLLKILICKNDESCITDPTTQSKAEIIVPGLSNALTKLSVAAGIKFKLIIPGVELN